MPARGRLTLWTALATLYALAVGIPASVLACCFLGMLLESEPEVYEK